MNCGTAGSASWLIKLSLRVHVTMTIIGRPPTCICDKLKFNAAAARGACPACPVALRTSAQ